MSRGREEFLVGNNPIIFYYMLHIVLFSPEYTQDFKRLTQELRNFLTKLEGRLDEPMDYSTEAEVSETIADFEVGKSMIFLAIESKKAYWYIVVRVRDENWEWTAIRKYGKIDELYVDPEYRGGWVSALLVKNVEQYLREQWISYVEFFVMAGNSRARMF